MPGITDHSGPDIAALRYRVVYEALARLSCNINKSEAVSELRDCIHSDLKYLFDSVAVRFLVTGSRQMNTFSIGANERTEKVFSREVESIRFSFEKQAAESLTPQLIDGNEAVENAIGVFVSEDFLQKVDAIWVFSFAIHGLSLVASVYSGPDHKFRNTDIAILKIVCESFLAKIYSLELVHEAVLVRTDLEEAVVKITRLVSEQELIIQQRTEQLQLRNDQLSEIGQFNAHNIREPLTRIFGLLELSKISSQDETTNDLLPLLYKSSTDLDEAVKNVITFIDEK
ncbi:MAG: hypothetical protein EOP56_12180 [Sphingobacteriales bacterium]|nr:MAG: hypothetical protein EOP56_12180 [Sphingobacteriales bacterium]